MTALIQERQRPGGERADCDETLMYENGSNRSGADRTGKFTAKREAAGAREAWILAVEAIGEPEPGIGCKLFGRLVPYAIFSKPLPGQHLLAPAQTSFPVRSQRTPPLDTLFNR